jgi:hypothetical protein
VLCLAAVSPGMGAEAEPAAPNTVLFDTGKPLPELAREAALAARSGWVSVPEDNLTRPFQGDAVALNDRLIVVLNRQRHGADVYSQTARGPILRMLLSPRAAGGQQPSGLASVRILENNPGAVMLAAVFNSSGGTCAVAFRLAAGQTIIEARPGEGTGRLSIHEYAYYLAVPDFFGNDMVFAEAPGRFLLRLRLPAENFFLALSDRGDSQTMCLWPSRKQPPPASGGVRASLLRGRATYELEAVRDKSIWVAVLEGTGMWYERSVSAEDAKRDLVLDWKPPFSAKWRADLLAEDGSTLSWYFRNLDEVGRHGAQDGDSPPVCSLEAGRAVVRLGRDPRTAPLAWHYPAKLVVYAMDRDRATPLTTFCAMDVLRNTLGVGPCQYILQTEGLASETNPTPDNVMTWVEKQFARKKEKKEADEIHRQLFQMVVHVTEVRNRIGQYGRFAGEMRQLCKAAAGRGPDATAADLDRIAARLLETVRATEAEKPPAEDRAVRLANDIIGLEGEADAAAGCKRLGAAVRAIGARQDATLSNCRMAVRWLRQSAAMIAEDNPQQAELAKAVQARADKFLAGSEKQGR